MPSRSMPAPVMDLVQVGSAYAVEFGAAVNRVLKDQAYRHSAKRVSESMRQYTGAQGAADHIEPFAAGISRPSRAATRQTSPTARAKWLNLNLF
ncbi:MAG: hypothetical protein WCA97_00790 [Terriglobales bacterium]